MIRVLSNQGWSVWIVSASLQQIVEEAAYLVGVPKSKVIGMRLASDGSSGLRLSQTAIPPLTLFEGKAQAISTLIGHTPTLAVGDSDTDYDMLAMSDHGLIIDRGQPRLREGAERYGWWIQLGWSTRALQ